MERLTRNNRGFFELCEDTRTCNKICEENEECTDECAIQKAINKLGEYEDLEEQGLLLRLPFRIGDIIYEPISRNTINEYRVTGIKKEAFSLGIEWELENGFIYQNENGFIYQNIHGVEIEEIGKTVFLTKAEAEQKLKEMED